MKALTLPTNHVWFARFVAREPSSGTRPVALVLSLSVLFLSLLLGLALMVVQVPLADTMGSVPRQAVSVNLQTVSPPAPKPLVRQAPEPASLLEPRTILSAPEDRPAAPTPAAVAPEPSPEPDPPPKSAPRRVYGVRKVYARGLGTGGQDAGGLVTTRGNTLGGARDTLTATAADLLGELAALSTVDQAPEPLHRTKPGYSPAMRKARAQGTVTAYLLVDADGSVREVRVTEDIGWDSREVAIAALRRFRFRPAIRDGQPVAVWIRHHIRFEFQE